MKKLLLTVVTALAIQIAVAQSPAPDFTVTDIHGTTHTLSNYLNDGKTVVLDFFFTTCPPCIQWTPQIEQMYKDFGSGQHDLIVIGIDNGDSDAEVQSFENDMGTTYPSASGLEGGGDAVVNLYASTYNFTGFPTYAVVCPDGSITWDIWPISDGVPEIRTSAEGCGASVPTAIEDFSFVNHAWTFPNPASNVTNLEFTLSKSSDISIELYNMLGERVKTITQQPFAAGLHNMQINLSNLESGNYIIRMLSGNMEETLKVSVVK